LHVFRKLKKKVKRFGPSKIQETGLDSCRDRRGRGLNDV
jgi:hypothetical protein